MLAHCDLGTYCDNMVQEKKARPRTVFLCHAEDETEFVNYLYHLLLDESVLMQACVQIFGQDQCLEVGDLKRQTVRKNLDAAIVGAHTERQSA